MKADSYRILLLLLFLLSCSPPVFEQEEDLLAYIRDTGHGYLHHKTVKHIDFSLMYKPTDLMVAGVLGTEFSPAAADSLRSRYGKYMYFVLSMSVGNRELLDHVAGNRTRFGTLVNDLAFHMDRKVHCYTPEKDTLPMADFIYPRMYGMSGSTEILLVYPRDKRYLEGQYLDISVEDLGFYTGEVKFRMQTDAINNEPQLKTRS